MIRLGKAGRPELLNGGFGYTDATLQQNTASGGTKGEQLQDVPKWTANATLD